MNSLWRLLRNALGFRTVARACQRKTAWHVLACTLEALASWLMPNSFDQLHLLEPSPRARRLFWHLLSVGSARLDGADRHEGMDKPGAHLFWVQSGKGTLEAPGRSYALKPGACCWLVDMRKPRNYAPLPGGRIVNTGFRFGGPELEAWREELGGEIEFAFDRRDFEFIRGRTRELAGLARRRPARHEWEIHVLITQVLGRLLKARRVFSMPNLEMPKPLSRAIGLVMADPHRDWKVTEVARAARMSRSGLQRMFRTFQHESIGGDVGSFHHNLLAHCAGRNWSLAGGLDKKGFYIGRLDLRNNVIYNWKNRATDGGAHEVNFVNNYYKPGPATTFFRALNAQYGGFAGTQRYYFEGNVMPGHFETTNQAAGRIATTERGGRLPTNYTAWADAPFFEPHIKTHSAHEAYDNVLANVGCNFPALDEHDARVIAEVRSGAVKFKGGKTGLPGLPDSQDDVGGWESYPAVHLPAHWDTDHDGMPDNWEQTRGLDPNAAADGNADRDGDGYTNLEEYLGWLVGEFPGAAR